MYITVASISIIITTASFSFCLSISLHVYCVLVCVSCSRSVLSVHHYLLSVVWPAKRDNDSLYPFSSFCVSRDTWEQSLTLYALKRRYNSRGFASIGSPLTKSVRTFQVNRKEKGRKGVGNELERDISSDEREKCMQHAFADRESYTSYTSSSRDLLSFSTSFFFEKITILNRSIFESISFSLPFLSLSFPS